MKQVFKDKIKKILVVRTDRFGEFILNIPAIRALKETFPIANLSLVVSPQVKGLAENLSFVDMIIEWNTKRHRTLIEKIRFIRLLKKERFNLAVMLNPSKEFNIFAYLAGIPVRLGYDRKCAFLLTHRLKDKKHLGQMHEVEYNLQLVSLIGAQTKDQSVYLPTKQKDEIFVNALLKKYDVVDADCLVALHPWTSDRIKQWPLDRFKELVQRLTKDLSIKVILIGGEEEKIKSEGFSFNIPELINLTGGFTLMQSAALLKKARLLISNDSGPVHLAASVNTPVVAIFRSDMPAKRARRWGPWGKHHSIIEKKNLWNISVDEVFNRVNMLLNKK